MDVDSFWDCTLGYAASDLTCLASLLVPDGRDRVPPCGTYMGDPPPGLSVRGAFFGRKSDKEVCGGVESVVSEPCARRWQI